MSWLRVCKRSFVFAVLALWPLCANAQVASHTPADSSLAPPVCVVGGPLLEGTRPGGMPPGPVTDVTSYILTDLASELHVDTTTSAMSQTDVLRYREFVARNLTGDPDDTAFSITRELQVSRPATADSCASSWTWHIYELAGNRATFSLAEARIPMMVQALSQYGEPPFFVRAHVDVAQSFIDLGRGRYEAYNRAVHRIMSETPLWIRPFLALRGFSARGATRNSDYLRGIPSVGDADVDYLFNAYGSLETPLDCRHVALFKLVFERRPQFNAAFPGMAARLSLCAQQEASLANPGRQSFAALSTALEQLAARSASAPGFRGWRQSALYEHAAAMAEARGDRARAEDMALQALAARTSSPTPDALRAGDYAIDPRLWYARLLSIRLAYARSPASARGLLAQELIAVGAYLPRSSADQAVRELSFRLSTRDPRVDDAMTSYRQASERAESIAREMLGARDLGARADASANLTAALRQRDDASQRLQAASPVVAAELNASGAPDLRRIQQSLQADEAMLILFTLPEANGVGLVVRRDSASIVEMPISRRAAQAAGRSLRESLDWQGQQRRPFAAQSAWALYQGLVAPFSAELSGISRLVIVPDAITDDIPWPALLTARPGRAEMRDDELATARWLLDQYSTTVLTSPAAFVALRQLPQQSFQSGYLGIASSPTVNLTGGDSALAQQLSRLAPIDSTDVQLFGAAFEPNAVLLTDDQATEANVVARINNATSVIGFSTHGLFAGELSGLSEPALVLTGAVDRSDGSSDGLLMASEIANLRLRSPLVLLTACNTAAGNGDPDAETLSGLVRAFQIAGARNVVATYWAAESGAVALLAEALSAGLIEGETPSVATRHGLRAIARTSEYAHPHYWATFGYFGAD